MRTNVGFTSNIPRRRARFDHDAIDDGHAKHVELHTNKCIQTARTMRNTNVNYATEHLQP